MTKREAEERRLEKRARKIGKLHVGCYSDEDSWSGELSGQWFDVYVENAPTRLAALRDLLRRCDRFADKVVASREGE